jgi:hypothetical protein
MPLLMYLNSIMPRIKLASFGAFELKHAFLSCNRLGNSHGHGPHRASPGLPGDHDALVIVTLAR